MSRTRLTKRFCIGLIAIGMAASTRAAAATEPPNATGQAREAARSDEQQHFGNYDGYYHMPDRPDVRRYRFGYPPYWSPGYPYYSGRYFYGYPNWRPYPYGYAYPYSYPYYRPYYWYF